MLSEGQEILEGRFKIIKKLGSGAFGEIFKGKFFVSWSSYDKDEVGDTLFLRCHNAKQTILQTLLQESRLKQKEKRVRSCSEFLIPSCIY